MEKQELTEEEKNRILEKRKQLEKKYGVMKDIPRQVIDEYPKEEEKGSDEYEESENLTLKVERIEGKLEVIAGFKEELSERISQLAEDIGELRGMIMEADQAFGKIEKEFEEIKDSIGGIEPQKIKKAFEKRDQEILESKVKIEKIGQMIKELEKEAESSRKLMEKIKDFENLVEISQKISEKINTIEETKRYSERIAGKIESMFSEITEKVNDLQKQKEKIIKLDELTTEITQMLDEISVKVQNSVKQKDLDNFMEEVNQEIKKASESFKKIEDIKNLFSSAEIDKKMEKIRQVSENLSKVEEKLKKLGDDDRIVKLKDVVDKQNEVIANIINTMEKYKDISSLKVHDLKNIDLTFRFYQLLNSIPFIEDKNKIKEYSDEMKKIIREFKENGEWDPEKEKFMIELLNNSKKIIKPPIPDEILSKVDNMINWLRSSTEEIRQIKEIQEGLKKEMENVKKSLARKVETSDIGDVFVVERGLIELTDKFNKMKNLMEKQNVIIADMIERIKENESKTYDDSIKKIEMNTKFYQLLTMLPYVIEPTRIRLYLADLKETIHELKSTDQWDNEKEVFMKNFLSSLSASYKSRGYEEIGKAYGDVI